MTKNVWPKILVVSLSIIGFVYYGCRPIKALGKNPDGEDLKRIEALPNYKSGEFQNLEYIPATIQRKRSRFGMLKYFFGKPAYTKPPEILPSVKTDLKNLRRQKPTVVWFGHSSFLLKTSTATILFDPNFSGFAGPFSGLVPAFEGSNVYTAKDMPPIDALIISHDHYDHLDYQTVKQLKRRVAKVIVPIGVGSHFKKWGYHKSKITELNWNESATLSQGIKITATPAHHRSNRTFESKKTLWASYVIEADGYKIYFSGDSGYSSHFKLIGDRYGPFDLALMECGQYNVKWPQSHMFPYQTAQATADLKAATVIPMHWGKFAESEHPWNESVKLFLKSADSLKLNPVVPFIGQPYSIGETLMQEAWWE